MTPPVIIHIFNLCLVLWKLFSARSRVDRQCVYLIYIQKFSVTNITFFYLHTGTISVGHINFSDFQNFKKKKTSSVGMVKSGWNKYGK